MILIIDGRRYDLIGDPLVLNADKTALGECYLTEEDYHNNKKTIYAKSVPARLIRASFAVVEATVKVSGECVVMEDDGSVIVSGFGTIVNGPIVSDGVLVENEFVIC